MFNRAQDQGGARRPTADIQLRTRIGRRDPTRILSPRGRFEIASLKKKEASHVCPQTN
jgi:hypothetical protein